MKTKYDDIYDIVSICVECGEVIEPEEAHKHTFMMGKTSPVYYHEECCVIEMGGKICKSEHYD